MHRLVRAGGSTVILMSMFVAACSRDEAAPADSAGAGPDTAAIQGAGTVPSPPPSAVDSLRDTSRQKTP